MVSWPRNPPRDGLPLGLATAGTYLGQTEETASQYLDAYEHYWHELNETVEELLEYEDRTLFSTWNLSLIQVRAGNLEAAEILRLLPYFGSQGVIFELLRAGRDSGFLWLFSLTANKPEFDRAMARQTSFLLVEVAPEGFHLHACVHDWTLQALNREIYLPYFQLAIHCVASNVMSVSERDYWQTNQRLIQHLIRLEHSRLRILLDTEDVKDTCFDDLHFWGELYRSHDKLWEAEQMY